MTSLPTFLTFRYLEENLGPGRPRGEADLAAQELELHLAEAKEDEIGLLKNYSELTGEDFASLVPHVHEWFLERIIQRPTLVPREQLVPALRNAFFLDSTPTIPYLAVNGLIVTASRRPQHLSVPSEQGIVSEIIFAINERINPEARRDSPRRRDDSRVAQASSDFDAHARLDQLAEILLDLYQIAPLNVESAQIPQALAEVQRLQQVPEFIGRFNGFVRQRIDRLSAEKRRPLEALLSESR